MKSKFAIVFFCSLVLSKLAFADSPDAYLKDPPGVHGMLLFGEGETYFSHLPMFHRPHDYQVLLQVQLDADSRATYLKDQASPENANVYYTFVPEKFVLPQVVNEKKCFNGTIYRGHFERGGIVLVKNSQACIENVLDFEKLNPIKARPATWTGLLFGSGHDSWLVHKISSRPDFDQVIHVTRRDVDANALSVTLSQASEKPVESGKAVTVQTSNGDEGLNSIHSVYIETGDLE